MSRRLPSGDRAASRRSTPRTASACAYRRPALSRLSPPSSPARARAAGGYPCIDPTRLRARETSVDSGVGRAWDQTDLLSVTKLVDDVPVLGQLAVFEAMHIDAGDLEGLAICGHAQEVADHRPRIRPPHDDLVALRDDVLDREMRSEAGAEHRHTVLETGQTLAR